MAGHDWLGRMVGAMGQQFAWKALTPGTHPPVGRLKHKVSGRPICPCQVPDAIIDRAWGKMWFGTDHADPWVARMILVASVGFTD